MSMLNRSLIEQQFRTDKYKRFWYPTRPFFTLGLGLALAGLGIIGLLPVGTALWLAAALAFDDLPLTPIMSLVTAVNNKFNGRKKLKSTITIIVVSSAIIFGSLSGLFLLSHSTAFIGMVKDFIAVTQCSPLMVALGAFAGGSLAHYSNKVSHFVGVAAGAVIMSLIPIQIPLIIDFVFVCAAGAAFVASVISKQCLRAYMKFRYGDTNADGYEMDKSDLEKDIFIQGQANKFHVTKQTFRRLISLCRERIQITKEKASLWQELTGERQTKTNSYKDIYFGLMNKNASSEDVILVKELLYKSMHDKVEQTRIESPQTFKNKDSIPTRHLRSKPDVRMLFHQAQIAPGIEDAYINPFIFNSSAP